MNFSYGYDPDFPIDDEGSRRVILVVSRGEKQRILYDQSYKKIHNSIVLGNRIKEGLCILENSLTLYNQNVQYFLRPLNNVGLLEAGNILIQDTYKPEEYFKFDQQIIEDRIIMNKWRHYTTVCKYLGVKKVTLSNEEEKETNSNRSFKINSFSPLFNLGTDNNSFSKKMEKKLKEIEVQYPGGSANVQGAIKYLEEIGWVDNRGIKDADINFLIRNREGDNSLQSYKENLNLFAQIEQGFDLAINLVIPQSKIKGNVKINQRNNMMRKFITKVELAFGDSTKENTH
ncbi:MAG: hypothetical protein DSM106950_43625 [Stigonema ocellatum SAG 48.90 = DSM 106950]|nr:hypothetical protein [Stigonema ocellatum SAG 48.90 = DSM 106950]